MMLYTEPLFNLWSCVAKIMSPAIRRAYRPGKFCCSIAQTCTVHISVKTCIERGNEWLIRIIVLPVSLLWWPNATVAQTSSLWVAQHISIWFCCQHLPSQRELTLCIQPSPFLFSPPHLQAGRNRKLLPHFVWWCAHARALCGDYRSTGKDSTNERDAFDFYTGYAFLVRGLG